MDLINIVLINIVLLYRKRVIIITNLVFIIHTQLASYRLMRANCCYNIMFYKKQSNKNKEWNEINEIECME